MATFVTIGYGDQVGYDRTAPSARDAAHVADAELERSGAVMGRAGTPVQVRNHDNDGVVVTDGPFGNSRFPIAGFALIEAATLEHAIEIASMNPCAVAHGVVEVWPLQRT